MTEQPQQYLATRPQTDMVRVLTPGTWNMIQGVAQAAYESRKFGTNAGEAAIKMLFCYENGLPLSAANTGLYVVNNKLAPQSNVIAAQIRKHPDYDYRIKQLDDKGCIIVIQRRNPTTGVFEDIGETSFTEDDAKRAGLINGTNYQGYPRNMFFGRAITNAMRWFAPDVFSQPIYTPEELGATVDADGNVIDAQWTAAPAPEALPQVITLDSLLAEYGAEKIMAANGGKVPGTADEIQEVASRLENGNASS